ncbi:DMT family transporter [Furfurilactobacillus siliginis]|uniref:DMT family transporter n=1 Tax=Furfurilactobacillus siliginis TaxID=348151 RepID=UPI001CDCA647|nr:DMT family transporter [Furfurilactobacillus siliginis]
MKVKTLVYVIISTFLFSSMEIALKIAGGSFNPIELNFIRFLCGGLALLPIALHTLHNHQQKLHLRDWGAFALTGFACVVVSMTLYQMAIQATAASTVAILLSANPVFGMLIGLIFLGEKMTRTNTIAVCLTLVGLLIIINPFKLTNPMGILLGLLCSITFGLYGVLSRVNSGRHHFDGLTMTCFSFIAGAAELGLLMLSTHIPGEANFLRGIKGFSDVPFFANLSWSSLPLLAYVSILVTGVAFGLYFIVMDEAGIPVASLIFFIKPALAPVLALIVLGEPIYANTVIGIVVILIGSVVTLVGEKIALTMSSWFGSSNHGHNHS